MKSKVTAGVWKTNITPPVGIPTAGSFDDIRAQEIMDELYAGAIVIDDGGREIAIVSADVCAIPDDVFKDIIERIEKNCGIAKDNIIIAATHTHTGPKLGDVFVGVGEIWENYVEYFREGIVTAVYMAKKRKQPVKIGAGKGKNGRFTFNRRLKKPDGPIIMNWTDKTFLQDCTESGPVDPEVTFIVFEDSNSKPVAFIINYACHNNAMCAPVISADWSGYMARVLSKVYGEETVALFIPGACGNVNWLNYRDLNQGNGPGLVKKIGTSLTGTVLENMSDVEYPEITGFDVLHKKILISDRPFCDYDIKEDITFGTNKAVEKIFAHYRSEREFGQGKELPVNEIDIHVLKIGEDIAIITNPGELFTEYGLAIKAKSPFKYTLISELTNGYAGYICTRKAFDEGGYEVRKTNKSCHLDIEAGEMIVDVSIELLNK